ncbi:MAG: membrane protein insertion efficiency factor YidD [Burkholderiaceae bacterium]|nr:membrane protein insertion efficiency factor YidD [Burkholderiaceae bacterium]
MKTVLLWLVRAYQVALSPMFGPSCRFYPTCSNYAMDAIREHGALKGAMLAAVRLAKCHPWHPGGFDPVPKKHGQQDTSHACNCGHH